MRVNVSLYTLLIYIVSQLKKIPFCLTYFAEIEINHNTIISKIKSYS